MNVERGRPANDNEKTVQLQSSGDRHAEERKKGRLDEEQKYIFSPLKDIESASRSCFEEFKSLDKSLERSLSLVTQDSSVPQKARDLANSIFQEMQSARESLDDKEAKGSIPNQLENLHGHLFKIAEDIGNILHIYLDHIPATNEDSGKVVALTTFRAQQQVPKALQESSDLINWHTKHFVEQTMLLTQSFEKIRTLIFDREHELIRNNKSLLSGTNAQHIKSIMEEIRSEIGTAKEILGSDEDDIGSLNERLYFFHQQISSAAHLYMKLFEISLG